jgi:hypothetical protein
MNIKTFISLFFWTIYNASIVTVLMYFTHMPSALWGFGYLVSAFFTCIMMAVTVGNQNKETYDEATRR